MDYEDPVTSNREADALELKSKAQSAQLLIAAGYHPDDVAETVGLPSMRVADLATQTPALPPNWVAAPPHRAKAATANSSRRHWRR